MQNKTHTAKAQYTMHKTQHTHSKHNTHTTKTQYTKHNTQNTIHIAKTIHNTHSQNTIYNTQNATHTTKTQYTIHTTKTQHTHNQSTIYISQNTTHRDAGTRKGPGGQTLLKGTDKILTIYVKIHARKFKGSVAFFLRQILTHHILSTAYAITLDINTSQISSIYSANSQVLLSLKAP